MESFHFACALTQASQTFFIMRKIPSLFALLFFAIVILFFWGLETPYDEEHIEVSLMIDGTDASNNLLRENPDRYFRSISESFKHDRGISGHFQASIFNDLGTKSKIIDLGYDAPGSEFNPYHVSKAYQTFLKQLEDTLRYLSKLELPETAESRIFEPISWELQRLMRLPNTWQKNLIIVSDFLENTGQIDLYHETPDSTLYERLKKANPGYFPDDLTGLNIYLNSARDPNKVEQAQAALKFFRTEFEKRHAKVSIESDLQLASYIPKK